MLFGRLLGIVFACSIIDRLSLARLDIESLYSTWAGNGYPAVGFEQRESEMNMRLTMVVLIPFRNPTSSLLQKARRVLPDAPI